MSGAKYYIYWNLHKDCYSVRFKGKVIGHYDSLVASNVRFRVSEKGRQRVLAECRKNVHAFVVADKIFPKADPMELLDISHFESVRYNPYRFSTFVDAWENPVFGTGCVWLTSKSWVGGRKADIKICR